MSNCFNENYLAVCNYFEVYPVIVKGIFYAVNTVLFIANQS